MYHNQFTNDKGRSNDLYITLKASAVEPDYIQGPNPDGPAMISLQKEDSC